MLTSECTKLKQSTTSTLPKIMLEKLHYTAKTQCRLQVMFIYGHQLPAALQTFGNMKHLHVFPNCAWRPVALGFFHLCVKP